MLGAKQIDPRLQFWRDIKKFIWIELILQLINWVQDRVYEKNTKAFYKKVHVYGQNCMQSTSLLIIVVIILSLNAWITTGVIQLNYELFV